jgi:outer membrane protein OmpA-like peptidoglycan-associated protein
MKTLFKFIIAILLIGTNAVAQNVEFDKSNFLDKKDQFKEAKSELKEGDEQFEMGDFAYREAIPHYLKAQMFNPNNDRLNYRLGICYTKSFEKAKCLSYLEKAYQLNPAIDSKIRFYLGYGFQLNTQWDKAIEEYEAYKKTVLTKDAVELKSVDKQIYECRNGKELMKNPIRVFIDNVGPTVNTQYNDYTPVISADESMMMFTSRRPGGTGTAIDLMLNETFEDIWVSNKDGKSWTKAVNLGPPINTNEHDAVVALSPDGQRLITFNGRKNGGDLFLSTLEGTKWSEPENMGKAINTKWHEPSATLSFDGKTIYFVSDREGGLGGHDIYMSKMNEKGKYETAVNVGATLNTEYDEDAVFMLPDGKTMYFSSHGHTSMGGYDIFKTTLTNGVWSKPENMGYPINSPDNDIFFQLAANGIHAYYSTANNGGFGGQDIYRITILGPEKNPLLMNEDNLLASVAAPVSEFKADKIVSTGPKLTVLKGIIRDDKTKEPLEASIELVDNTINQVIATFKSNSATGKYLVSLPSGKNYGLAVKRDGYLFHSENFDIPAIADYQEVEININLKKIEIGQSIVLKNIFFDFDKATIRSESANELDRLIKLLTENPTLKIELGSHTDSKGSDDYNQKLSQARSQSVVTYLINKGISTDRLVAKGYGETVPVATNDTEAGRQENRRTEFKILSK